VKNQLKLKFMIVSALFAAMTTTFILFVRIPAGPGIIHVGDSLIYLAACILPAPYALIAAALGGAMANALGGHFIFIIPTFIIKALISLPFSSKSEKILTKRNALMVFPAGLITIAGYFLAVWILFDYPIAIAAIYGDLIQASGSAVLFIAIAAALDKIKFKQALMQKVYV
jgi:uncharacterized repeat protein (TIGR04002 family)